MHEGRIPVASRLLQPINVFISYAEQDEERLQELIKYLSPLEKEKLITLWHRGKKMPQKKNQRARSATPWEEAQIILLLITGKYVSEINGEGERILLEVGEKRVIRILIEEINWRQSRLADWQRIQLDHLLAFPMNLVPIKSWPDKKAAFDDVVKGIRRAIAEMRPHAASMREVGKNDVEQVVTLLEQKNTNAIVLTGIDGSGKSTLAAHVRDYVAQSDQARQGIFGAKPLWLEITPTSSLRELAETVLQYLKKPLPDFEYLSADALASVLTHALSATDNPCLIILDQFERVLDMQTGKIRRSSQDIEEWLKALNSRQCACKLLFTGYFFPLIDAPVNFLKEYQVKGFEVAEGMAFLKSEGVTVADGELQEAVVRCQGHRLALNFLVVLLRNKQTGAARMLLADIPVDSSLAEVVEHLLHTLYQRLNERQRKLLLAFSIYREDVPLDAVQDFMSESSESTDEVLRVLPGREGQPDGSRPGSKPESTSEILRVLREQSLIHQGPSGNCYRSHTVVSRFVLEKSAKDQLSRQNMQDAYRSAAHYYENLQKKTHPTHKSHQQKSHIHALIEAIWHHCQAEEQQDAFALMDKGSVFSHLERSGYYTLLRDLLLLLVKSPWKKQLWQEVFIVHHLGQMHAKLGEKQEAKEHLTRTLFLYLRLCRREAKNDSMKEILAEEFKVLNELAEVYKALHKEQSALNSYKMALDIARQGRDAAGEGMVLNNLGRLKEAMNSYNEALKVYMQIGDHRQQAETHLLLANVSARLGEDENAEHAYEEAFKLFRQQKDEGGKLETLNRWAEFYLERGQSERAEWCLEKALLSIKQGAC